MNKILFAIGILLVLLSGCAGTDNTLQAKVLVHEKDGTKVKGATVNACNPYSFSETADSKKWLSLKCEIVSSRETDASGIATMSLPSLKYAFFAKGINGHYGGTEQYITKDGETVEITVSDGTGANGGSDALR